jgi:hypothetical protein
MTDYVVRIGTDTRLLSLVRVLGDGKCNAVINQAQKSADTYKSTYLSTVLVNQRDGKW